MHQVGDGIHFVEGRAVNWTIVAGDDGVTLIDAGYPGSFDAVVASIREAGYSTADLRAILVTHAHIDHVGTIPALLAEQAVPVLTSAEEARHTRREYLQQATPLDVARNAWRPGALAWTRHILAEGATKTIAIESADGVPEHEPIDVPGAPVPFVVPGHTDGHTCYLLGGGSVVVSGDSLITGHMLSRRTGPQLIPAFFDHDHRRAVESLSLLAELDATTMLPGHGPLHRGPCSAAVAAARG